MKAKINNRTCDVEIISKEGNAVTIRVDDRTYNIDAVMSENGFCSIIHQGRSYNAEAVRHSEGKYSITTHFRYFDIELSNARKKYLRNGPVESESEVQESILSPMPGKVLKILVSEDEEVSQGDPLIVLEAMKMQSTYTAAQHAMVEKIHVKTGDSVARDQVLITFKTI